MYLANRLLYSFFCLQTKIAELLNIVLIPILDIFGKVFLSLPIMKKRLAQQGRSASQAIEESRTAAIRKQFDKHDGSVLTEANVMMILISYIISSIIIMLPQLLFSYPYVASLLNQYTMLSILFVAALGFLILYLTIWRNDIYLAYFKKFQKDSRVIRWSWHVFSLLFVITLILLWIPLFKYCMSLR